MDLRQFIEKVDQLGELKRIEGAHWDLEIGALTFLVAENPEPPALLFDKIEGYGEGYRVLALPYVNNRRSALIFGLPLEASSAELVNALRDKLRGPMELIPPVEVKEGPVMENIDSGDKVDLFKFPTPKWQHLDGGRYIGTGCYQRS